jgi:hypothetical protein
MRLGSPVSSSLGSARRLQQRFLAAFGGGAGLQDRDQQLLVGVLQPGRAGAGQRLAGLLDLLVQAHQRVAGGFAAFLQRLQLAGGAARAAGGRPRAGVNHGR